MKTERGKFVSRSVYQKLAEENKRLMADLKTICMPTGVSPEGIICRLKWRKHFEKEERFNEMMKDYATQYFKDNPHELISVK